MKIAHRMMRYTGATRTEITDVIYVYCLDQRFDKMLPKVRFDFAFDGIDR